MKVIIYCYTFFPYNTGYSNAFQNFVRSISSNLKDFEITVITPCDLGNVEELQIPNVKIIRIKRILTKFGRLGQIIDEFICAKKVEKFFKKINADVLFVETADQVFFLSSLSEKIRSRTAIRIHATNETELTFFGKGLQYTVRKYILRFIVSKKFSYFTATNSFHINFIKKHFMEGNIITTADKFFYVIPNSINAFRENYISTFGMIKVITLGRMDYIGNNQKGFVDIFRAIQTLPINILRKMEFTVVGSGDMREFFIDKMSCYPNVQFIENLTHQQVIEKLVESDVVVLASRYEGLSMFALEALSTSNVCVYSKTGGLLDLIDGNGFSFDPQDIEGLSSILASLPSISAETFECMKRRSVEICATRYSDEVVSYKFRSLCQFIVN